MGNDAQQQLWHERFEDALADVVSAAGGPKRVGQALWGRSRSIEDAARWLNKCLDPERAEKLSCDEIVALMRLGRERHCDTAMAFLAQTLGYEPPKPLVLETEREREMRRLAEIQEQFNASVRRLEALALVGAGK